MTTSSESAAPTAYKSLRVERPGELENRPDGVAQITLIGPGKNNGMGPEFWEEMPLAIAELDADPAVRAIVIAGQGRNFSYGLDLGAMMPVLGAFFQEGVDASSTLGLYRQIHTMRRAIDAVFECTTPTIAAVQGRCIGGGVDLISACDVRHCSADASFSIREVKVGIVADMGSLARLPHIIGEGITRELALTGRDVDAEFAKRHGLVTSVAADAEAVLESAHEVAGEIAANAPLVVCGIKDVLNKGIEEQIRRSNNYVATWNSGFLPSQDLLEAINATLERRNPEFRGK